VTADDLYRAAETALVAGNLAAADRALGRLVIEFPSSSLVDQALYERARIAYQQKNWAAARRHLDQLAALPRTTLAEPGQYLACRIAVQTKAGEAVPCLVAYRKAFPTSPHDVEALALIVQLTHASTGCAGAASQIDELVRMHPKSRLAAAWRARCPVQP
jgi:outer membrane protein assembly factor BamD (BamD/ComL family)